MLLIGDANKAIDAAAAGAAAGKWEDVTAATTTLAGVCTSCHTAHRERMDDGTYRIK
jgi:cytochrome c556